MTSLADDETSTGLGRVSLTKGFIILEVLIVLGISFGRSALNAIISIIEKLTRGPALSDQTTPLNPSITPDRPWLDLTYQLYYFIFPLTQVMLVLFLLYLAYGRARSLIGFNLKAPGMDLLKGLGICAGVGIPGIGFYLLAREIGINTNVTPANLTNVWWTIPILICAAMVAGISEEVIMLGYLFTRLKTIGWSPVWIIMFSSAIRGTYHLYQGFGGLIGNLVMGVVFSLLYLRWKRVMPLVIAHAVIDIFAFVGYSLLAPYISWL